MYWTLAINTPPQSSVPLRMSFAVQTLPIPEMRVANDTANMLRAIETIFGDSVTDIARMLRVSRPMVYHYREGMEPSLENKRRIRALATLASELSAVITQPLKAALKKQLPEGRTLVERLSEEILDVSALRRICLRDIAISDQALRNKLAHALSEGESAEARSDIIRSRHAQMKAVYVGDPEAPGKLIRIHPDGTRTRGQMVKRQFVPDDE
jgi:predicted transcriptional regulator